MVEDLLKCVYQLPSIPKVVQELLETFGKDTSTVADISEKIQTDPVISAKVLRMANSARYGVGRKVASLDAAVVLLGFDAIRTLVVASGVTGAMMKIPGLDMKAFWKESFLIANISRLLAKTGKEVDPEIAFTCGMIHKIGTALMYLGKKEEMQHLQHALEEGQSFRSAQRDAFGYDCDEVSAELAAIWRFPELIQEALRYQSKPKEAEDATYASVIYLADRMCRLLEKELTPEELMAQLPSDLMVALGIDTFKLFEKIQLMSEVEDDIDQLLCA